MEEISQTEKMRTALEAAKKVIKGNYQDAPDEYEIEQAVLTQIDDALKEGMVKDAVGPLVYIKIQTQIENALKELGKFEEREIVWTRAAPLIDVLQVALEAIRLYLSESQKQVMKCTDDHACAAPFDYLIKHDGD